MKILFLGDVVGLSGCRKIANDLLDQIKKNNIINECYTKADYFINLASNSLSIFEESKEKDILKKLTSFSLERSF